MPKRERMEQDKAVAWVKRNGDGKTWSACAEATGVPRRTLQGYCQRAGVEKRDAPNTPPPNMAPSRSAPKTVTPAEDLAPDDRAELVAIVRDARGQIASTLTQRAQITRQIEGLEGIDSEVEEVVDRAKALAMLVRAASELAREAASWARMMRDLLDAHPGLMAEVQRDDGRDEDAIAARVGEAYGASSEDPPAG